MGTPEFAVPSLEAVFEAGHHISTVFTQPDRPKGRGGQLATTPVKLKALELGIPVFQPERVRRPEIVEQIRSKRPDAMVVVGYGQIIPQSIIDIPPLGIINVHASLLPKYRGAAPIQWAIADGEAVTGVTTMRIDAGLDTGDMLFKWSTAIGPDENAIELGARLAAAGADLLVETLRRLQEGSITPEPQDPSQATLAPILKKQDGALDWSWPARVIHNRTRGFQPWPGAYTTFRGQQFQIWRTALPTDVSALTGLQPGRLQAPRKRLWVECGEGTLLELLEVQIQGRKRISVEAFLSGHHLADNEILGAAAV
jgi:methionyl-tRNA formyltransferase